MPPRAARRALVVHALHDDAGQRPLVLVEDTTRALGLLAAYHRARFTIPVVAVTGSNGKTTERADRRRARMRWHVLSRAELQQPVGLPLTLPS
jgi:UDP-N-acetylmuramoyl-tripeptide--D-alanyl-D-alanine ligase